MIRLLFWLSMVLILGSCGNGNPLNTDYKPKAISKSNDLVVVADKQIWEGEVGDTFRYYFESAYPITPSPEPIFKLRFFTPQELDAEPLRKQLRTYCVLANLADTTSWTTRLIRKDYGEAKFGELLRDDAPQTGVGMNKWAMDQLIIYIYSKSEEELIEAVREHFHPIASKIHEHDATQIKANTYISGRHLGLTEKLSKEFGIKMDIPGDYREALSKKGKEDQHQLLWLRKDTPKATLNLVFQKMKYKDIEQISVGNAIALTNEFGANVQTDNPESKLRVNQTDLPILENVKEINGNYTLEIRGIWEMTQDFMGGPFVSYLIPQEGEGNYIFIHCFVYAPGIEKKQFLQELEVVVNSFDFL